MEKRVNFSDVKTGDLMALVTFVKVTAKSGVANAGSLRRLAPPKISVQTTDGSNAVFDVEGQELVEQMFSADRFTSTKEMTKTQLAEKLVSSYNVPFTVEFEKQNGELRKLRGVLLEPEPLLGRSKVRDFDASVDGLRLVDHRTLQSIIVKGVRYTLKGK